MPHGVGFGARRLPFVLNPYAGESGTHRGNTGSDASAAANNFYENLPLYISANFRKLMLK